MSNYNSHTALEQKFITSTLAEAISDGCDLVQPKIRGMKYVQFRPNGYNLLGVVLLKDDTMPTRTVLYDVEGYKYMTYRARFAELRKAYFELGEEVRQGYEQRMTLIENHRIGLAKTLWDKIPSNPDWCGLVLRRSLDSPELPIRVVRWYQNLPRELE